MPHQGRREMMRKFSINVTQGIQCDWPGLLLLRSFILVIAFAAYPYATAGENALPVAGWIERAALFPDDYKLHAKLDTGAKTSSINAVDTQFYTRDGSPWVRFELTNRDGDKMTLKRPVVRTTTIKRHFGGNQKRPVIKLDICVGSIRKVVEVNLVDRTGLNYQLLIGRNFLAKSLLIDSRRTYVTSLGCPGG